VALCPEIKIKPSGGFSDESLAAIYGYGVEELARSLTTKEERQARLRERTLVKLKVRSR
jgi:hypothetical protein